MDLEATEKKQMNKINGKIVIKETGVGLPDLLIVVHDLGSQKCPKEVNDKASGQISDLLQRLPGRRIGSVLTDKNGRFALEYPDAEVDGTEQAKRPSLVLLV